MSSVRSAIIVDFESFPITPRPGYPPEPVGVAIDVPGRPKKYYAWAHPTGGNNCTWAQGRAALAEVWDSDREVCFHHAKFDLSVAAHKMALPPLPWRRVHDTMLLLYLSDPRVSTFSLKPSAERLLGEPPTERDEMMDWLIEHVRPSGHRLSTSRQSEWYAGAFVAYAPPSIAGRYAIGDLTRTRGLLNLVHKDVLGRGMGEAYDRERKLLPIMMELEDQGLRVDVARLRTDVALYSDVLTRVDAWLCKRLRAPSDTNWNSTEELAKYLITGKAVDTTRLARSRKTGKHLTNKEAIEAALTDPQVGAVLVYRAKLKTDLNTFMRPWLETAERSGGYIFTTWHATRSEDHGATTGRFSSTPNFQNMPKECDPLFRHEAREDHPEEQGLPRAPIALPPLPFIRSYVITYEDGDVLIDRDYSQQEYRILAHFEGGALLKAYLDDPWIDLHEHSRRLINNLLHANYARKPVKNTGFGILYGLGLAKLARKNRCSVDDASRLRVAFRQIYPGLKTIQQVLRQYEVDHVAARTWGGREYFCEEPRLVVTDTGQKKLQTYGYRMLNNLIQPSAADCTKEALIRYWATKPAHHRILTIPHDEFLVSVPQGERDAGMECLRAAMESVEFKVPMLSEGKWGRTDWAHLEAYDKAGKQVV